ncbi:hypothetical protein BJP36_36995 [Moorena producens JHB]|uniref:Uncharacterized protein n=1 Tax=Moorena producens (strain JHB) TaxID=1454205 RepID=A0A9Q9UWA1_MOOP1|nr:hypothetical protein [Moorena producens]WAN69695.1 hypothetical protein BJP36_36995 [Moorena producens JHB]
MNLNYSGSDSNQVHRIFFLFPISCSGDPLFPVPCSLFPVPCSRFPTPYSLLPTPYSLCF